MRAEQLSGILLLGIGGGGCRIVCKVVKAYGPGLRAICADTDALMVREAQEAGVASLLLGGSRLAGAGTGGDPVQGRLAAQDDLSNLLKRVEGVRTVVLVSCLGGGTGSGATAELARQLHERGMVTFAFVLRPFSFEGAERIALADRMLPQFEEHIDSAVLIAQDDLFAEEADRTVQEATAATDKVLCAGITLLWNTLHLPGFIRLDPERLRRMILRGGNARFGMAEASGPDRAEACLRTLSSSSLLKKGESLAAAGSVLFGILAGDDLRLVEIGTLMRRLREICKVARVIEMGTVLDPRFDGTLRVVAVAFDHGDEEDSPLPACAEYVLSKCEVPPAASADEVTAPAADVAAPQKSSGKRKKSQNVLSPSAQGKFWNVDQTVENGENLDVPTYQRRRITLER